MIEITIPGQGKLNLLHLVLDYNGTIAFDGRLIGGVRERLAALSRSVDIHVLTADTFGSVARELSGVPCQLFVIPKEEQARAKADYTAQLGNERCACVGNGRNDVLMLQTAALGIAVIQAEGASARAVLAADIVTTNVLDALDLLANPLRLAATLRS